MHSSTFQAQLDLFPTTSFCSISPSVSRRLRFSRRLLSHYLNDIRDTSSRGYPLALSRVCLQIEVLGGLGGAW